jgi:hypothetical protein
MRFLAVAAACGLTVPSAHCACAVSYWTTFNGTEVFRTADGSAYFYRTKHVRIDADGAPNAYHPQDIGLDYLANAGYPNTTWWRSVLVPDPFDDSRALVRAKGPFAGYFISKTSLAMNGVPDTDPRRYVDATVIPYMVFPTLWLPFKGSGFVGDFGYAKSMDGKYASPAILGDSGGGKDARLGEISVRLAELLGAGVASPRTGPLNPMGELLYAVFPGSSSPPRWPLTLEQIRKRSDELLAKAGGWPASQCLTRLTTAPLPSAPAGFAFLKVVHRRPHSN